MSMEGYELSRDELETRVREAMEKAGLEAVAAFGPITLDDRIAVRQGAVHAARIVAAAGYPVLSGWDAQDSAKLRDGFAREHGARALAELEAARTA